MFRKFTLLFSVLLCVYVSKAQLCQGSLGDPIVNITFGSGATQGNSLPAASTNYQFVSTDCPTDGFYTVRNKTIACYSDTWHTLQKDHTGDPNGYFMLVNASFQPGTFYLDTVRGLCSNTTYEFASWMINMVKASSCGGNTIQPNITFNIESVAGAVLQTYNSGNIPATSSPQWKQYGFSFTTPANVSDVVLRIVNNAPGGCGNDIAIDDITFRMCGPKILETVNGGAFNLINICQDFPTTYTMSASISPEFSAPEFQWQRWDPVSAAWSDIPGANTISFVGNFPSGTPPGSYQYRLAVSESGNMGSLQCRVYTKTYLFTIVENPVPNVVNSGPVCLGSLATLTASGGSSYSWGGPGGFSSTEPTVDVLVNEDTKFYVKVFNTLGCMVLDSTTVVVAATPVASTNGDEFTICENEIVQLQASGGDDYTWSPAAGLTDPAIADPDASPDTTTNYRVIVSNANCHDTAFVRVNVIPAPAANAGPDRTILSGQFIQLNGGVTDGADYHWEPPVQMNDPFLLNPVVNPLSDQQYILYVQSPSGCGSGSDTMNVKVYNDVYIPNAFTPNGDGLNDRWQVPAIAAYDQYEISVYDRWGVCVFNTKNTATPWDGKHKGRPLPMGAYHYLIIAEGNLVLKGSIMLIR